jgi:ribonuclease P protein component
MLLALTTLKSRNEFLAVRGGARASVAVCLLEARKRQPGAVAFDGPRFGFTITKKLGNAVTRNRIRRRLKAALTSLESDFAADGFDYVVVARQAAFNRPFAELMSDLRRALETVHNPAASKGTASKGPRPQKSADPHKTQKKPVGP